MAVRVMSDAGVHDMDSQCLSKVHVLKGRSLSAVMANDVDDDEEIILLMLLLLMSLMPPPRKLLATEWIKLLREDDDDDEIMEA